MLSKSLREMIKGRWREFRREPSAFFFVIFMPVIWMVILGLAFSTPNQERYRVGLVEGVRQGVVNEHYPDVYTALRADDRVALEINDDAGKLQAGVDHGELVLWIAVEDAGISYYFDPANPEATRAQQYVNATIQEHLGRQDPLPSHNKFVAVAGKRYIDFLIPGLLALSFLTTSLYGTGMTLVANRRENLLKRYRTTPMKTVEFFLSHIVGRFMIFFIEVLAVLAVGIWGFDFTISGSWFAFLSIAALGTAAFTALGILCGSRLNNSSTYNSIANLIVLPMMMLSGIWFSRDNFPHWLATITDYLPLTATVNGLRHVALEGASLGQSWFEILILVAYLVAATALAKKVFRWY